VFVGIVHHQSAPRSTPAMVMVPLQPCSCSHELILTHSPEALPDFSQYLQTNAVTVSWKRGQQLPSTSRPILGAFAFVSVRLYACGNSRTAERIFIKLYTGDVFEKLASHFNFGLKRESITGTLHEDLHALLRSGWLMTDQRKHSSYSQVSKLNFSFILVVNIGIQHGAIWIVEQYAETSLAVSEHSEVKGQIWLLHALGILGFVNLSCPARPYINCAADTRWRTKEDIKQLLIWNYRMQHSKWWRRHLLKSYPSSSLHGLGILPVPSPHCISPSFFFGLPKSLFPEGLFCRVLFGNLVLAFCSYVGTSYYDIAQLYHLHIQFL
jgi:hypothetical protein